MIGAYKILQAVSFPISSGPFPFTPRNKNPNGQPTVDESSSNINLPGIIVPAVLILVLAGLVVTWRTQQKFEIFQEELTTVRSSHH